jgi:hypothetical protein
MSVADDGDGELSLSQLCHVFYATLHISSHDGSRKRQGHCAQAELAVHDSCDFSSQD